MFQIFSTESAKALTVAVNRLLMAVKRAGLYQLMSYIVSAEVVALQPRLALLAGLSTAEDWPVLSHIRQKLTKGGSLQ